MNAAIVAALLASTPHIPLCPGLTIVTAVSQPTGDYESIKRIDSIKDGVIRLKYSSEYPERHSGALANVQVTRMIPLVDTREASLYLHIFQRQAPARVPGTTAIGTSTAVLHELKTKGSAEMGIVSMVAGNVLDYEIRGEMKRASATPVTIPITVNDAKVNLPAIHVRGDFDGDKAEFFFLDDEKNPLALRYRIGTKITDGTDRDVLNVVRISYDCSEQQEASIIEQQLAKTGRVDVYSIFFSFNSDVIREESQPTLKELGDILRRHPDWKLAIGGHTDNIASDKYNLALSQRRADSVKNALVTQQGVATSRLTTAGYGESAPRDTNDTLEGRARNRRVELVRLP